MLINRFQPCTIRECRFYSQYCYYTGPNIRRNHVLIIPIVKTSQAKGIRDSTLDIHGPSEVNIARIQRHKITLGGNNPQYKRNPYSATTRKKAAGLLDVYVYLKNNINTTPVTSSRHYSNDDIDTKPRSNAVQENSSQVDVEDLEIAIKEFFSQLKQRLFFSKRVNNITAIEGVFLDKDFEIKAILKCSLTRQVSFGFREGQHNRFRIYTNRYRAQKIQQISSIDIVTVKKRRLYYKSRIVYIAMSSSIIFDLTNDNKVYLLSLSDRCRAFSPKEEVLAL